MNNDVRIANLKQAIKRIDETLPKPHWSDASKNVLRKLRDRHAKTLSILVKVKK